MPCLYGYLDPIATGPAAKALACSIARHRIPNDRLLGEWHRRAIDGILDPLADRDRLVLEASVLQNVGTVATPARDAHLHGLIAEAIWFNVVGESDVGLGQPIRVEGHDWSVTDPGGDGLTVYVKDDEHHFRLWESKYHGQASPIRETVADACNQISERALAYLARFSLVAQYLTADLSLAEFYGRLAELWVDKDRTAGVGIVIGSNGLGTQEKVFDGVIDRFELGIGQHQGHLNIVGDFAALAASVREVLQAGCGQWTER